MNPLNLPFDTDAMIAGLKPWIECESPTYDADAVNRMMDIAAYDMAALGAQIERIPG
ncbi:MAG TPA: M20/M25/M40 family metallo-hydrolase, partial [Roseobacter sp.]|nr:M20/M25/M40 family metallo-hydrolase [Roseobacter sp.]